MLAARAWEYLVVEKAMNRQQELDLIEKTRSLLGNPVARDQIVEWYEKNVSQDFKHCYDGVVWEALGNVPAITDKSNLVMGTFKQDKLYLFMAAIARCMASACSHVKHGKSPVLLYALLGPRILTCKDCVHKYLRTIKEFDRTKEKANECDLCLKIDVKVFFAFRLALNGIIFIGDACPDCKEILGSKEQS